MPNNNEADRNNNNPTTTMSIAIESLFSQVRQVPRAHAAMSGILLKGENGNAGAIHAVAR
jgi:hypothetical protein